MWLIAGAAPFVLFGLWIGVLLASPVLAPILPRPAIVPWRGAAAHFDWKGYGGLAWEWCETTPSGRVQWSAFDGGRAIRLGLSAGRGCRGATFRHDDPPDVVMWDHDDARLDWLLFHSPRAPGGPVVMGGSACDFFVPPRRMASFVRIAGEARTATPNEQQAKHLGLMMRWLERTDGYDLVGSGGGQDCSAREGSSS